MDKKEHGPFHEEYTPSWLERYGDKVCLVVLLGILFLILHYQI